jgi:DNA-binding response OmpR family regulator
VPPLPGGQSIAMAPAAATTFIEYETEVPDENDEDDQRPLLLVVEDNADVRFFISACVSDDYRVATAENGAAGIQKAIDRIPDIIISDVMMPEKDGLELCETLKNDERTSHIPIVLLTARADVESRMAGLRRGADDYLAKPFEPGELLVRLENLVKLRLRLQQRYAGMSELPAPSQDPDLAPEDAFLGRIRDVVESRLSETEFDMPRLERALGMSRSQVFRKVKALTGASPSVLIRNIRLQKSRELLRNSTLTIAEIAYEVGFSTPAYFSTMFQEAFGKTPSEWRQG